MKLQSSSTVRVRYGETDQMRFAYHANYVVWCDVARTDFIRQLGVTYAQLEDDGLLLAVAEATVRYIAAARYDDVIRIDCRLAAVQSRAVTFEYEMFRTDPAPETRIATASTKLVSLDRNGALRILPPEVHALFRAAV